VPYWQAPAAFDAWAGGFYTPPPGRPLEPRRPGAVLPGPPFAADLVAVRPAMRVRTAGERAPRFAPGLVLAGLPVTARVVLAVLGIAGLGGLFARRRTPAEPPPPLDHRVWITDDGVSIAGRLLAWDDVVAVVVQRREGQQRVTFLPRLDERLLAAEPSYPVQVAGRAGWTCDPDSYSARPYQASVWYSPVTDQVVDRLIAEVNSRCPSLPVQDERPGREWSGP
jgi:hypothetical protein